MQHALDALIHTISTQFIEHDKLAMDTLIADLKTIRQSVHRDNMIQRAITLVYSDFNHTEDVQIPKDTLKLDCQAGGREYEFIISNALNGKYDTRII